MLRPQSGRRNDESKRRGGKATQLILSYGIKTFCPLFVEELSSAARLTRRRISFVGNRTCNFLRRHELKKTKSQQNYNFLNYRYKTACFYGMIYKLSGNSENIRI